MNNNNLVDLRTRTAQERKEIAKKGAIASAETKRENKIIKDEIIKRLNAKDFNEIIDNLIERAKHSGKDFKILRDTLGQKPKEEINLENNKDRIIGLEKIIKWED